jgi:hypothetical protein
MLCACCFQEPHSTTLWLVDCCALPELSFQRYYVLCLASAVFQIYEQFCRWATSMSSVSSAFTTSHTSQWVYNQAPACLQPCSELHHLFAFRCCAKPSERPRCSQYYYMVGPLCRKPLHNVCMHTLSILSNYNSRSERVQQCGNDCFTYLGCLKG